MMKKAILILFMGAGSLAVRAQIPQPDPDTTAKHFLIVASIGNLREVSDAQLAIQKAERPEIRSFAQMMVKDHSQAEQQLLQLAKSQDMNLPISATAGSQADLYLASAGANFDQLYVNAMVSGHGSAVQTFQAYAVNGKDPEVKAWAKEMLPTLKMHLDEIKMIDQQLNHKWSHLMVTSSAFPPNGLIPAKYSCEGSEVSPPLNVTNLPAGTKSLAIVIHDPDAPNAGGVTHWVIWNIPVSGQIAEGFKGGVQGKNSDQKSGYKSICPPDGKHHYNFKVYALDEMLQLDASTDKDGLEKAKQGHVIGTGLLSGLYTKKN